MDVAGGNGLVSALYDVGYTMDDYNPDYGKQIVFVCRVSHNSIYYLVSTYKYARKLS